MNLEAARGLLQARLGLRLEGQDEARLRRAIQQRMTALGLDAGAAYLAQLHADAIELAALAGLLTIKETYFWREPQHLRLVTGHLAPLLLRGRAAGAPVRILSAGCATGEEPYSIAMALRERYAASSARLFRIEGVDLDSHAIAGARTGRYRPYALRALAPDLRARWFTPRLTVPTNSPNPSARGSPFTP
ncbi:CheR family methyltransferase [uncultured Thiodictyon sp.]|uniref:CheR family methyltransferase n=1 Tax=uncultured Thiodictyon sp. TaxID=1846217 RepID=UPI0025D933DE|nr:CheR family methyltransferase [uncultured Thiodictyon sp.]